MRKNKISVGIDLGTTMSSISYYDQQKNESVVVDSSNIKCFDSYVSLVEYTEEQRKVLVGPVARNKYESEFALFDAKRIIGREWQEIDPREIDSWPFQLVNDRKKVDGKWVYTVKMSVSNQATFSQEEFHPIEVSAMVLRYLMLLLDQRVKNAEITNLVIGVPTNFNDKQRNETIKAAKLAGLTVTQLTNEPVAAIMEYKHEYENELEVGDKILVIDFGGGTLDVCLCENRAKEIKTLSIKGDPNLGGNNFDRVMMEMIKQVLEDNAICKKSYFEKYADDDGEDDDEYEVVGNHDDENEVLKRIHFLRKEAERIKKEFSEMTVEGKLKDIETINLQNLLKRGDLTDESNSIKASDYEYMCKNGERDVDGKIIPGTKLIDRFKKVVLDCLKDKGYSKNDVTKVLMVGGTCKMPMIRKIVTEMFGAQKIANITFDPLTAVCKGASYIAHSLNTGVETTKAHDTIPYSIGFEGDDHEFLIVAESGKSLPIRSERIFDTTEDNQTSVICKLFAGNMKRTDGLSYGLEACLSDDYMEHLDTFEINNIPPALRGQTKIRACVTITTSGTLQVTMYVNNVQATTVTHQLKFTDIEENFYEIMKHFKEFLPSL